MVLSKIQDSIAQYKQWLQSIRHHPQVYEWESVQHFQAHWKDQSEDPGVMFEQCFYNSENRRMWQASNWEPRKIMQVYWDKYPATVRLMFNDLFNETREVEGRIGRFLFGCDELLRDFKRDNPTSVENNHYHGDYRMIAIYLGFRYPESYAPYDFVVFQTALTHLGARDIPQENDLSRYFKVLRTLTTFIDKDPQVQTAMKRHLHPTRHFQSKTMLLTADLLRFIAKP